MRFLHLTSAFLNKSVIQFFKSVTISLCKYIYHFFESVFRVMFVVQLKEA